MKEKIEFQLEKIDEAVTSGSAELARLTLLDGSRDETRDAEKWEAINDLKTAKRRIKKAFEYF